MYLRDGTHSSIRTNFVRPEAPLLIVTWDLRTLNCAATSTISSSFARPSTGGDLVCASHVPSSSGSSIDKREFGLTLIWIVLIDTSFT